VRPERLELPAYWFEASRSIQLSYGRTSVCTTGASPTLRSYQLRLHDHGIDQLSDPFHLHAHFVAGLQPPRRRPRETHAGGGSGRYDVARFQREDARKVSYQLRNPENQVARIRFLQRLAADRKLRPAVSKPIQAMSNGVSSAQLCSGVSNTCGEPGVRSVSVEKPRFAALLLPLVLPAALASPAWYP
jgi:hypothetical protein